MPSYHLDEVRKHSREEDCWLVINGKVYDVTKFLDEHPGGVDVMLDQGGCDATAEFEAVGHSEAALKLAEKYQIGTAEGLPPPTQRKPPTPNNSSSNSGSGMAPLFVLGAIVVCAIAYFVMKGQESTA